MIQSKLPFHSPSTSTTSTSTSQTTITTKEPQIVLVLCGVVGTGKSTLAIAMEQLPGWVRINQDELKTRSVCETRVHKALREVGLLSCPLPCPLFSPLSLSHTFLSVAD